MTWRRTPDVKMGPANFLDDRWLVQRHPTKRTRWVAVDTERQRYLYGGQAFPTMRDAKRAAELFRQLERSGR